MVLGDQEGTSIATGNHYLQAVKSFGGWLVRADLEAASIPLEDEAGRVFDFHALRHQFISRLAAAGVHPQVAQTLAKAPNAERW